MPVTNPSTSFPRRTIPSTTPKKKGINWSNWASIGANVLGGLLNFRGQSRQQDQYADAQRLSQAQFDSTMDESIQRRVKDAMKAGVHPLFALGAGQGASPTITTGASPPSGRSAGGDMMHRLAKQLGGKPPSEIALDESMSMYYRSMAFRGMQNANSRGADTPAKMEFDETDPMGEPTYYSPEIPKSQRAGVVSGTNPLKIEIVRPDGERIEILNPGLNLDEIAQADFLIENAQMDTTLKMEGIAAWIKQDSPSNADVRRLSEQLRKWKNDPQGMQKSVDDARGMYAKVVDYWKRFHNWRRKNANITWSK